MSFGGLGLAAVLTGCAADVAYGFVETVHCTAAALPAVGSGLAVIGLLTAIGLAVIRLTVIGLATVGLAAVGLTVVGLTVVGLTVVGLAVIRLTAVGLSVEELAVKGLGVVGLLAGADYQTDDAEPEAPGKAVIHLIGIALSFDYEAADKAKDNCSDNRNNASDYAYYHKLFFSITTKIKHTYSP